MKSPEVRLARRGVERWKAAHPWIYRSDLAREPKQLAGGEVVRVADERGHFLGQAFYSSKSKIALRWLAWNDTTVDAPFFAQRLALADSLRRNVFPGEDTYRVVHGESDLLPGLIVDRYGDYLCVQFLIQGAEARKTEWLETLWRHFSPKGIVNRSDGQVRLLEGLPQEKGVLRGEVPPLVPFREGDVESVADLLAGQKTGAFLDQRENHVLSKAYAQGDALDCFSYHGGFALQLAQRARTVTAVEISAAACATLRERSTRAGISNVEVVEANAFDFLRDAVDEGKQYDTIVLDPPSFAKNRGAIDGAVRGYKELNLRALMLLRPGGHLITASCTYHVDEQRFEALLESAAADAKKRVQIIERRGASRDHPVLLQLRETRYLKCFVLRVVA
ncbi:MAG: class I SAM-dependent rRNA methyltransferase [Myxococcaceae bacterium]